MFSHMETVRPRYIRTIFRPLLIASGMFDVLCTHNYIRAHTVALLCANVSNASISLYRSMVLRIEAKTVGRH